MTAGKERLRSWSSAFGAAALLSASLLSGCSIGTPLRADQALPAEATGTYRLYLYGCHYAADIEDMALLVDQSSPYRYDLYVLNTSYRIEENLSGKDALSKADAFVRCSTETVWKTVFRRITDPAGRTIAFELKPLYDPLRRGTDEVLVTNYTLQDGTVTVYIRRNPLMRREDGGGDPRDRSR